MKPLPRALLQAMILYVPWERLANLKILCNIFFLFQAEWKFYTLKGRQADGRRECASGMQTPRRKVPRARFSLRCKARVAQRDLHGKWHKWRRKVSQFAADLLGSIITDQCRPCRGGRWAAGQGWTTPAQWHRPSAWTTHRRPAGKKSFYEASAIVALVLSVGTKIIFPAWRIIFSCLNNVLFFYCKKKFLSQEKSLVVGFFFPCNYFFFTPRKNSCAKKKILWQEKKVLLPYQENIFLALEIIFMSDFLDLVLYALTKIWYRGIWFSFLRACLLQSSIIWLINGRGCGLHTARLMRSIFISFLTANALTHLAMALIKVSANKTAHYGWFIDLTEW